MQSAADLRTHSRLVVALFVSCLSLSFSVAGSTVAPDRAADTRAPTPDGVSEAGSLSGVVTLLAAPVEGAAVCATSDLLGGTQVCGATSDAFGAFTLSLPPADDYEVEATVPGLPTQCYDNVDDCLVGGGWSSGMTSVSVNSGSDTPGIDFRFGCREGAVLFHDSMEHGAVGWAPSGLWRLTSGPACAPAAKSAGSAFHYGQSSCSYETGSANAGILLSPVIASVPAGARLSYWQRREADSACSWTDISRVLLWVNGSGPLELTQECDSSGQWLARLIDLSGTYTPGDDLQIGFEFDTDDANANDHLGWMIDDVRVFACDQSPSCADADRDGLCDGVDNCPAVFNPRQKDRDQDGQGDPCDPLRVNFAPTGAAVPDGFVQDDGALYDEATGFGWDAAVSTRNRTGHPTTELATFAFSSALRTWTKPMPDGLYAVRVVAGDADWSQGPHRVVVNGVTLVDDLSTPAGSFVDGTGTVHVRGGLLKMNIGGAGGLTMINLLEVTEWVDPRLVVSINFQPAFAVAPDGFSVDSGDAYDAGRGFGWSSAVATRQRDANVPTVLDTLAFTTPARTWEYDLPPGVYDVHLTVGDPSWSHGPQRVVVEGAAAVDGVTTSAGSPREATARVSVRDARLTLDLGGGGGVTAIDQLSVSLAPDDVDGDGVANPFDNCGTISNADQADLDGDGAGDVCDVDDDGDGVDDEADNCPLVANPAQSDRDSDGIGNACDPIVIDFAPSFSSVPAGSVHADELPFSAARGHGWTGGVLARERGGALAPELRTFVFTQAVRRWQIELPNGDYVVRAVVGDADFPQGPHRVLANGVTVVDGMTTSAAEFAEAAAGVRVSNGRLELEIGGAGGNTALALVELTEAAAMEPIVAVNFQPAGSVTPEDYLSDSGLVYDAGRGYGWSFARPSRERGDDVPQTLDTFVFSTPSVVWELDLAPGTYQVDLAVGDADYAQGPQRVVVEGTVVLDGTVTAAREFVEATVVVEVTDGKLTLQIGGAGGTTVLDQVVVRPASQPASAPAASRIFGYPCGRAARSDTVSTASVPTRVCEAMADPIP